MMNARARLPQELSPSGTVETGLPGHTYGKGFWILTEVRAFSACFLYNLIGATMCHDGKIKF